MNTMLRSTTAPKASALAPSNLTTTQRPFGAGTTGGAGGSGGVHKGIWIGGGLMALTIVALATALVVRSNSGDTAAQVAATTATATAPALTDPNAAALAPQATTPAPVVAQATPAPVETTHTPTHTATHHTTHTGPTSSTTHAGSTGNTTVASADSGTGATGGYTPSSANTAPPPPPVCHTCGTVESYDAISVAGQTNGVGAVGGGALGAVLGSKIAGRNNHTLGGVIGAVGGGLLGNEIERRQRTTTEYNVHVRMEDGSTRIVREKTQPNVGEKVTVENGAMRPRSSSPDYSSGGSYGGSGNGGSGGGYSSSGYSNGSSAYGGNGGYNAPQGNGGSSFTPSGN